MRILLDQELAFEALAPIFDGEYADELINGLLLPLLPSSLRPKEGEDIDKYLRAKAVKAAAPEDKIEVRKTFFGNLIPPIEKLDPAPFLDNPYAKILASIPSIKEGDFSFLSLKVPAYLPFSYKEKEIDVQGRDITHLGYFEKEFHCPALQKNGVTWMSLLPHEIVTMAPDIEKAKGKVLCLGLGLGYFPFMAASKNDVSEVTIVEKDPVILSFFQNHVLPLLPCKDKIRVIEGDALKLDLPHFDFSFADLWHDPEDGLPLYCRLLKNEKADVATYWIEKDILVYLRRYLSALIEEAYEGYDESDYPLNSEGNDRIFALLFQTTKNITISSMDELKSFLSLDSVKKIAETIDL